MKDFNLTKIKELFVKAKMEQSYDKIINYNNCLQIIKDSNRPSYQQCLDLTKTLNDALTEATESLALIELDKKGGSKKSDKIGVGYDPKDIFEMILSSAKEAIWDLFDRANALSPNLTLEVSVAVSIVPEKASYLDSIKDNFYGLPDISALDKCKRICESNDVEVDDDLRYIRIHMYDINDPARLIQVHRLKDFPRYGELFRIQEQFSEYLPCNLLAGYKEGDTIQYKETLYTTFMEFDTSDDMEPIEIPIDIIFNLTANQLDGPYSKHGNFEDTYRYVMNGEVTTMSTANNTVEFNATAFVIPNPAVRLENFSTEYRSHYYKTLCEMNDIEVDLNDKYVEIWLTNKEELKSDNLASHGLTTKLEESGTEIKLFPTALRYIPYKLIQDVKEGETVTYLAPYEESSSEDYPEGLNLTMKITIKCQQQGFRYQHCGNFEDIVKQVINSPRKFKGDKDVMVAVLTRMHEDRQRERKEKSIKSRWLTKLTGMLSISSPLSSLKLKKS